MGKSCGFNGHKANTDKLPDGYCVVGGFDVDTYNLNPGEEVLQGFPHELRFHWRTEGVTTLFVSKKNILQQPSSAVTNVGANGTAGEQALK